MKRLLAALLFVFMLGQALSLNAFAAVGKVLSPEELQRAYALTGLGEREGIYHNGMRPNASWSAMELADWLADKLENDIYSVEETLSRANYTLYQLETYDPGAYERFLASGAFERVEALTLEAEALREELGHYRERLTENAGLIAQMTRALKETKALFDSDRVRKSARIEQAVAEIRADRDVVLASVDAWEKKAEQLGRYLRWGPGGMDEDEPFVGDPLAELFVQGDIRTNAAPVTAVNAAGTRLSRLSGGTGFAANPADAEIVVISDTEIAFEVSTAQNGKKVLMQGVKLKIRDINGGQTNGMTYSTDRLGIVRLPTNRFITDRYDVVHLELSVDGAAVGCRDMHIDDLDLDLGEIYRINLVPQSASGNALVSNADDDPYLVSAQLGSKDICFSDYEMIYSTANDYQMDIKVEVANAQDWSEPVLSWYENAGGFSSPEKHTMKPTGRSGNVYTFRGAWRSKFSPEVSKDHRPAITLTKGSRTAVFVTRLISRRSATDKPINEGSGAGGGVFGKVLGKGLSLMTDIPLGGDDSGHKIHLGLNLPFNEYLPKLNINPAGFIVIWIGSDILGDKIKQAGVNWKSNDQKEFTRAQKWIEKEAGFANYMARFDMAFDYYHERGHKFLADSTINIGLFAVGSGRWELDNSDPDVKTKLINFRVGFGVTATYALSLTWSYPVGGVPVYVSFTLGLSLGFGIELDAELCWVNGEFQNWKLRPVRNITINIGVSVAACAGVGIKGFLDIYVKLGATLNIMIQLYLNDTTPSNVKITYGATFTVGATLLFVDLSYRWTFAKGTLYDSSPSNLLDHYMHPEANAREEVKVVHQSPDDYPALVPVATELMANRNDVLADVKLVNIDSTSYLFFIAQEDSGLTRVHWRNLSTGKEQSFSEALRVYAEYDYENKNLYDTIRTEENDCGFDVRAVDGMVVLVDCYTGGFDREGFPRNGERVIMSVLEPQDDGGLSALFNRTTVAESEHETTSTRRFLIVRNTAYNRLADLYDSMTDPQITDVAVNWQNRTLRMMFGVTIRGTMTEVRRPGDESAPGVTFFACPGRDRQSAISLINDRKPFINPHQGYERTRVIPIIRKGVYATYSEYVRGSSCPDFVALNTPKEAYDGEEENPEPFIELFDGIMNRSMSNRRGVKLVQGDIRSIELFSQEDDVTRLFYTQAEVNADGVEQIRLHGLSIGPADDLDSHTRFDAIRTDYDLTLPTSRMAIGYIGATPYLYWWSAALRDGDEKQLVWRVWGAAYDPAADTLGDAHVLAQFQLPKIPLAQVSADHDGSGTSGEGMDAVVADVLLTASGTGYLVSTAERTASGETRPRVAAYSFKEQLKAVADVEIALPQATAVKAGDFEDIDIGIMNTGNLALAAFDVQMREVDAAGRAGNVVQTAHIDLIHPEKSSLALTGSKAELTGSAVAHRVEDYDYSPRQRDFILEKQMVRYRVALSPIVELESAAPTAPAENVHLSSDVLMPGSLGDFRTTFKIPDNWQGEKKLRLQVSSATVESNPLRAIADSSGLRPNAGDGGSVQLTYVLNEKTGKMALQRPPVANGAVANAIDSGIYPMEIEAGAAADLVTVIHDIDVDHRVYAGWDGSDWVDITVRNAAATGDALKLTCAVYPDGADTPSYVNLPYYRTATSDRHTQTLSMPVSALVGDETKHRQARVVISVVGAEECVLANNEFTVFPGGADPLRIEGQPASVEVAEGESARFAVTVAGGTKPYRCQWQVLVDGKWRDIPGATEATLQLEAVKTGWSGRKARCVVTDASGSTVISREVTLTVRPIPDTGDHSHLPLWLAVALLSATLLLLLRRKLRHT